MNNIIQHKRGSTYGWSLGPEIVNFENYTCKNKDSILSCQKNTIRFEVGTGSKNVFPLMNATEKIYGQWLIVDGELPLDPSKTYQCQAKVEGPGLVEGAIFICRTPSDPPLMNYSLSSLNPSVSAQVTGSPNWCVFAYWDNAGENYEYGQGLECTLTLSFKECNGYEELAPGQLGIEYTNDGKVKLKAGMPGINKWNKLPYIGGESLQPDWDVEDPEASNYIKNKPFGRVAQTVLFDGDATFSQPDAMANCYYYFSEPLALVDEKPYFIEGHGTFLCQNGYIKVGTSPISIYPDYILIDIGSAGGNTYHFTIIDPEPSYKTLAAEYLPIVHHAEIDNMNPISSHGVANIVNAFSAQLETIDAALDAILAIQNELIGVTLITFIIAGTEYQAEEGMTWGDLVGSKYDPDNKVVIQSGGCVGFKTSEMDTWNVMNESGDLEYESDIIRNGHLYGLD